MSWCGNFFRAICPKLYKNCAFLQNFYSSKLGEITIFFAVISGNNMLHFSVEYKFGIKSRSDCSRTVFMKLFYFFQVKTNRFQSFRTFSKKEKLKRKFWANLGQNICKLFHILAQFLSTTSETELDHYHQKVNVWVASLRNNITLGN